MLNVTTAEPVTWYRDGELLAGNQGKSLLVTIQGSYTASVTTDGCTSVSLPYQAIVTGLEQDHSSGIQLFPNPATVTMKIRLPGNETTIWELEVIRSDGRAVCLENAPGQERMLYIGDLSPGTYVLLAKSGQRVISRRFVKQ